MEKAKVKGREIRFFSEKNQELVTVHSRDARNYAQRLEQCREVTRYEACAEMDTGQYQYVNPVDIRKEYFETDWTSDFKLTYPDGTTGIRELAYVEDLLKRAIIERLEFSRRYWSAQKVRDWKVVLLHREGGNVL